MSRFLGISLVAFVALGLAGCDNTTARYTEDYAAKLDKSELLILPPYAEASMVNAAGSETRKYDYEEHIEPILADELQKKLEEKGYRARILRKKDLMNNQNYVPYAAFKESFKTAYEAAYKKGEVVKRDEAKKSLIHLDGRARSLGDRLQAPVMVYVDYNEKNSSNDAQAAQFAAGVVMQLLTGTNTSAPPDKARLVVAIIDGKDDKVLWTNPGASAGGGPIAAMVYTDEEQALNHVKASIDWAVKELPDRGDLFKKEGSQSQ